jgi:hypothetical protein
MAGNVRTKSLRFGYARVRGLIRRFGGRPLAQAHGSERRRPREQALSQYVGEILMQRTQQRYWLDGPEWNSQGGFGFLMALE